MIYIFFFLTLPSCVALSLSTPFGGGTRSMIQKNSVQSPSLLSMSSNTHDRATDQKTTSLNEEESTNTPLDPAISSQFKILTCSATSCAKRSRAFGLDEYALFSGLYQRKEEADASQVEVEESSCLGSCKFAPCVGIEHEDYYGTVALEGMEPNEFKDKVFQNVVTEEDLDRVWSSVENSIKVMMEQEEEEE